MTERPNCVFSLVAAVSLNGIIGGGNMLPWHIPSDMARFVALTMDKPVVMGRWTYESIGGPLEGRHNIVLSANPEFSPQGVIVVRSLPEAVMDAALAAGDGGEVFVIGGESVYRQFLPFARKAYITYVQTECRGDARFPALGVDWTRTSEEPERHLPSDDYPTRFVILERNVPRSPATRK
ncbi:MAG: dihydrofolate reductase [Candidatus Brocadiia bacterium]